MTHTMIVALGAVVLVLVAVVFGWRAHSGDQAEMGAVWSALEAGREEDPILYDPAMVADLPDIAQRYFARSIMPGTPLHRMVRLGMTGSFVLNGNALPMTAQQILAPPARGFVWQAEVGQGLMRFAGSDGYHATSTGEQRSWTKFWLHGLVPLARIGGTDDHARAAATRVMMEAIWVPASLLPLFGAQWQQTGPDSAEIRFSDAANLAPLQITFDEHGDPVTVVSLRWSDANSDKTYRLQPFGGRILETGLHQGFRIPVRVEMGNMFGMPEYAPFFLASITAAQY
jgi:hypothetical protein